MSTYRQIQDRVKATHGFTPKACWIADVKAAHGLTTRIAPNRHDPASRVHPCPDGKRPAIEDALRFFGEI